MKLFKLPSFSRISITTTIHHYTKMFRYLINSNSFKHSVDELVPPLSKFLNCTYIVPVNQARLGIYLTIKALIKKGRDEIILSPYTMYEVVNMVICAGGKPVFVDILLPSLHIDLNQIKEAVTPRTVAVMVTQYHTLSRDIDEIYAYCQSNKITLIEDAAIAFGAQMNGRCSGTFGDIGILSFGKMKNVCAFFGGCVVLKDEVLAKKIKDLNDNYPVISKGRLLKVTIAAFVIDCITHPFIFRLFIFWVFKYGYLKNVAFIINALRPDKNIKKFDKLPSSYEVRMSGVQASLIADSLKNVRKNLELRRRIALYYYENLKDIEQITLPDFKDDGSSPFLEFPIFVEDRNNLLLHLTKNNIDCRWYYYTNCSDCDCFSEYASDCKNTKRADRTILMLPTYPGYKSRYQVIDAIRDYYSSNSRSETNITKQNSLA